MAVNSGFIEENMATQKKKKGTKKISFSELSDKELQKMYSDNKKELQDLRFKTVTAAVRNVKKIRQLKRDIARILTALRQKEIAGAKG